MRTTTAAGNNAVKQSLAEQGVVYKRPSRYVPLCVKYPQETWQEYYRKLFQRIHEKHQRNMNLKYYNSLGI
ncbi:MAG: hypothetical protein KC415_05465 [Anaerolineales bacterium]|nr:hypothetical protein [Anaerolineales bacterium]